MNSEPVENHNLIFGLCFAAIICFFIVVAGICLSKRRQEAFCFRNIFLLFVFWIANCVVAGLFTYLGMSLSRGSTKWIGNLIFLACMALMPFGVFLTSKNMGKFLFRKDFSLKSKQKHTNREEIFDVVNDRDEVIGKKLRREVHRDGDKHRAVHVLVFNSRGEVFLQKRSMTKDTFPGAWDSSASGHLDCGEDYDACAVREVREELGLRLKNCPERLFKIEACLKTGQEFVWVYRCENEGPFRLHSEEIETGGWFAPKRVSEWIAEKPDDFASAFVMIWKKINGMSNDGGW